MQVPAYAPVVVGVHCDEYRGVEWSVVKTMDMDMLMLSIFGGECSPECFCMLRRSESDEIGCRRRYS